MGMYDNPPYYLSAYGLAVKHGYTGSESEWLVSITAYGLACSLGFEGTLAEWVASLKGETGTTAYESAVAGGYDGTEEEFADLLAAMAEYIESGEAAIRDGSITSAKLATAAVIAAKLAAGAVETDKLHDDAVTTAKIAALAITAAKIAEGAVTAAKIENGAVTEDKIAEGAVIGEKLDNEAVTADKLAPLAVTGEKLAQGAVSTLHSLNIGTTWNGHSAPFNQTISVPGMTAGDAFTVVAADGSSAEAITAISKMTFTGGADELSIRTDEEPEVSCSVTITQSGNTYTATIPLSWTATGAPYTQEISVTGIRSDSKVQADIVASAALETAEAQMEAWGKIYKITVADGAVTVYASEETALTIPVQLLEVKK